MNREAFERFERIFRLTEHPAVKSGNPFRNHGMEMDRRRPPEVGVKQMRRWGGGVRKWPR